MLKLKKPAPLRRETGKVVKAIQWLAILADVVTIVAFFLAIWQIYY